MCSFRWCLNLNAFPHSGHLNLRRSVLSSWLIMWRWRRYTLAKVLLQMLQDCDVGECMARCLSRWDLSRNASSHLGQRYLTGRSGWTSLMWSRSTLKRLNVRSQWAHLRMMSSSRPKQFSAK
jgi:hypothetical protein